VERKLRTFGRKLARWARGAGRGPAVDLEEIIDPAQFTEKELKLWEIHLRALAGHRQQPCSAYVTLFRTRGHPVLSSFAPDLRWGSLALGGATVKLIPGSHENIFMEPNVKFLATCLTEELAKTQRRLSTENRPTLLPS
jgi:thioesterase domain-containing protein